MAGTKDTMLTGPQVRARFGDITDMTLWRWLHSKTLGFPQPLVIRARRYWRLPEIEAWERDQAIKAATTSRPALAA